ncbi:type II toxin-antitoxin system RelE/ParE family toxin [Alkalicella caledoniensis]|uniref:Type II toxin-antitoxin system RelE/ParE family toxin n=1 Tax=Alkalicella caledoniensis TaxID=2731377 RepID=A0A7G9WAY8_ALKCA|nr:type II toxin-antitoxin system RelE/ParE family toxin [Alkalicella caledoniensis]QNO15850.1 type II toxin-antitoxin system RelE/ParE family toxin [Alkalicella caledoniensis]
MQKRSKLLYTPTATNDIEELFSYISEDSIDSALKLLDNIDDSIRKLLEFPYMGSMLSEDDYSLVNSGYRFIVVHLYLVFYRVINQDIIIHRVLHGRRDYLRELFMTCKK